MYRLQSLLLLWLVLTFEQGTASAQTEVVDALSKSPSIKMTEKPKAISDQSGPEKPAPKIEWDFHGVSSKKIKENIRFYFEDAQKNITRTLIRDRGELICLDALKSVGYYFATCDVTFEKLEEKRKVIVQANLGEPIRISQFNFTMVGEAEKDRAFLDLYKSAVLKEQAIFHHGEYEELKTQYLNLAQERGYFDAVFSEKQVNISLEKKTVEVKLTFNSGQRYRVSGLNIQGASLQAHIFYQRLPFKLNAYYLQGEIAQFRMNLIKTGYFSQVKITPQFEKNEAGKIPLLVEVAMQSRRTLRTGLGYATDIGGRVSLGWRQPWVSDKGHSFSIETKLSGKKNLVDTRYQIPVFNDYLQYYELGAQHKTDDILNSQTDTLNFQKIKNNYKGWTIGRFIQVAKDEFLNDGLPDQSISIVPGVYFEKVQKDGQLVIHEGSLRHYRLETSARAWGSDHDYLKLEGMNRWVEKRGEKNRFISRFSWGSVISESDASDLPETVRFRSGGDHSIRGFSFESIGEPNEVSGLIEGGRYNITGSLEYERALWGDWRAAIFTDSGSAFTKTFDAKTSVGAGVRWYSPLGPIRFDVAYPLDSTESVRFHLTMGPEF